jgi:hypothetical protein
MFFDQAIDEYICSPHGTVYYDIWDRKELTAKPADFGSITSYIPLLEFNDFTIADPGLLTVRKFLILTQVNMRSFSLFTF